MAAPVGGDPLAEAIGLVEGQFVGRGDIDHRGHRHRQNAVGAAHRSPAFEKRRDNHIPDPEVIQTDRRRHDVDNGIHRADFVEVHLVFGLVVGFGLRLGDDVEDAKRQDPGTSRQLAGFDDAGDLQQAAVLVMAVFMGMSVMAVSVAGIAVGMFVMMRMGVFVMAAAVSGIAVKIGHVVVVVVVIEDHVKVTGVEAALVHSADGDAVAFQGKAGQRRLKHLLIGAEIEQSRDGHIAADAGITFEIKLLVLRIHGCFTANRLI